MPTNQRQTLQRKRPPSGEGPEVTRNISCLPSWMTVEATFEGSHEKVRNWGEEVRVDVLTGQC